MAIILASPEGLTLQLNRTSASIISSVANAYQVSTMAIILASPEGLTLLQLNRTSASIISSELEIVLMMEVPRLAIFTSRGSGSMPRPANLRIRCSSRFRLTISTIALIPNDSDLLLWMMETT
nr:hypothetical protein [Tanacetum cinerariifolium]